MNTANRMNSRQTMQNTLCLIMACLGLMACSSGSNPVSSSPLPAPADITVSGVVSDGPVTGGSIFAFAADQVIPALESVDPDGDRLVALTAAASIVTLTREESDEDQYSVVLPGSMAGDAIFLVFDNAESADQLFRDTPPNLASIAILGDAGSAQRSNLSMQTTLVTNLVLRELDPDGDGTPVDSTAIQSTIDSALANVLMSFADDEVGRERYSSDFDPFTADDDSVHQVSGALGFLMRAAAITTGLSFGEILDAMAGDAADGILDGSIPLSLEPTTEQEAAAMAVNNVATAGSDDDIAVFAVGPCSSSAVAMRQACAVDLFDDLFELTAICKDIFDDGERADCLAEAAAAVPEQDEECDDIFDARLALCADVNDSAHEPMFGGTFAANFINPLQIGTTVPVNPWFPLVTGNRWVYEGGDETIEVEVTDETKLIDGVTCVVVIDIASEDEVVVEITRDWYAQDINGNVWYCGEIARNFEVFEGDAPEDPELVDIDGSWKADREGAEAGILLPFDPAVDDVIRQEVMFGEAEDVIEILSISATESSPGGSCNGNCLMTADTTPLEPDVEENKYYAPGIGLIVEVDVETGDRVELTEFTSQ